MTIQSNLYIEKISSEHPIAAWMLNDQLDYISLLTESERAIENATNWSITNATASLSTTDPDNVPFPDSHVTKILGSVTPTPPGNRDITIQSNFYTALAEFDTTLSNVSVSGNLYVKSILANSISFGYKYFNGASTVEVLSTKTLGSSVNNSWVFFSGTLDLPPSNATNIQLVFKINVAYSNGVPADYEFYLNGITFGQWSEEFSKSSLGLTLSSYTPPANFIPGLNVVPATPYGISSQNAYYIVGTNKMYAKNFGVPIVYGSSNITKLYYNASGPSLVFPGYGFLNEKGKYNTYTAEMWVKINADTAEPHRIFGPVYSNDGLYIEGAFLTFVIGNKYASHYVGEWYRPMLINIRYIENNLSVLLNGEQVINIPFIENDLSFPSEFNGSISQDWLGFYAHPDISPLEIDSFAIYSYSVANEVAKRRWVWGQGVVAPEQTGSALNAITSFNDYTYSDYSVNYNYPDFGKWDQAFFTNLAASSRSLELPSYTLPEFNFGTKTLQDFYDDNQNISVTESRINQILNPNFEVDTTGWANFNVNYSHSRYTSDKYIGTASLRINTLATTGTGGGVRLNSDATYRLAVTPGETVAASAYFKNLSGSRNWRISIRFFANATTTTVISSANSTSITNPTSWTKASVTGVVPAGATYADVLLNHTNTGTVTDSVLCDAVLLEKSTTVKDYFDGTYNEIIPAKFFISSSWNGTPNLSRSTAIVYASEDDADGYKFFTFKPDGTWNSINSSAYFIEYGFLVEPVESFYGLFKSDGTATNQILFKIENKITKEYFKASLNNTTLTYSAQLSGMTSPQTLGTKTITANQRFVAGVHVPTIMLKSINGIKRFFSNESALSIYMFGDGVENTFSGKVYSFNFDAKYNNRKLSGVNYSDGFFDTSLSTANIVIGHTANYTLEAFEKYGLYFLDVSISAYWQDYMPLTYFGKYVTDFFGEQHYDLDLIQFNIDYPEPTEVESVVLTGSWTYDDLYIWFRQDTTRTYSSMDNSSYTGWDTYSEMAAQTTAYDFYNTSDNSVRSYVTFQSIADGANQALIDFPNAVRARTNGIVDTNTLIGDWETSSYEVVDGSIIFPPNIDKNNDVVDFNDYGLVYHLDFNVKASLQNKVRLKSLQLASQVLERNGFTEMGTKFAVPVYPFSKFGFSYNYKAKNYVSTYKGTTPHLYLNRHSGWRVRKGSDDVTERGISMPINIQEASDFEIKGIQMWIRFSDKQFPTTESRVFSLESNTDIYDFYVIADSSGQRGKIYAKNRESNVVISNLDYYVNGILVSTPYLVNQEWAVLGVQFPSNVSFDGDVGRLNLNGQFTYNNVSAYLVTNLERVQTVAYRSWGDLVAYDWQYWKNNSITPSWGDLLILSSLEAGILKFEDIYKKYVGTNRIIIDDPTKGILVQPDRLRFYGDVAWRSDIRTPV